MKKIYSIILLLVVSLSATAQTYNGPESVEFDPTGNRYFVSNNSSGQILARDASGNLSVFATGISPQPYGLEILGVNLYACCSGYIKGWDMITGTQIFNLNLNAAFLNGITHDNNGNLYATDFSAKKIYRINVTNSTYNVFVPSSQLTASPNGIIWDEGQNRLVLVSWGSNVKIKAVSLADSTVTDLITTSLSSCDGIAEDGAGNFYISNWGASSVVKYNNDFTISQVNVMTGLSSPADIYYNILTDTLAVPNSGNNTVVFQSVAPATSITVCNDVPLTLFTDSTTWGADDSFIAGTDSMIRVVFKNTSNYGFAYPLVKFIFLDPLPTGMSVETSSQQFQVITAAWNPGIQTPAKCYFAVNNPIPPNYLLHFLIRATNLSPANVDSCMFADTFVVNLNPQTVSVFNIKKSDFSIYPNPVSDDLIINSSILQGHSILITDISGRKLKMEILKSDSQKISLIDFESGTYFISVLNSEGDIILTRKLVKE
ncbi:MAG: T9SS C-terminal target domain-containing protein [Sphingobacteriales bacterium]|nr:MAG: T9SS C-terminal target domain-containing protein [Sphingobacteriales bacterium]